MCVLHAPRRSRGCDRVAVAKTRQVKAAKRLGGRVRARLVSSVALLTLGPVTGAGAQVYTVTPIDTFGGASSYAMGLNDAGAVVGYAENAAGQNRAFLFSGGVLQDLGTLGGNQAQATAINNVGQIAGLAHTSTGQVHAFRYSAGTMSDLGTLGGTSSYAFAINDAGQVAGGATTNNDRDYHAFRFSGSSMQDLGSLGTLLSGGAESAGIDANGTVAGWTSLPDFNVRAFTYQNNGPMTPLAQTHGGNFSTATGIRNGVIIGTSSLPGEQDVHAARWVGGVISDLGTLPGLSKSIAYGQNGTGQVVGTSDDGTEPAARAFLHVGGTMIDLNDLIAPGSRWTLQAARGINQTGQVAGWGTFSGQHRAYLMNLTGKIWSNPAGGSFADAGNWFTNGAPAAAQPAAFPLAATYTVAVAAPVASQSALVARGDVTFDFTGGVTYTVADTVTIRTGSTLGVQGTGQLSTRAVESAGTMRITGGEVQLRPAGGTSVTARLDFGGSTGAWTGRLDVTDNALVIDYAGASPIANVRDQIRSGRGAGAWDGSGIASSVADPSSIGVGYAEASALFSQFPATFAGRTVDDTSVLVRATRYGDANLDGAVNLSDFNRLAANFGAGGAFWQNGDFNYDGNVNLSDFNVLAANFGLSAGPDGMVDAADWSALASAVPEPGAAGTLVCAGVLLGRRARRRATPPLEVA